MILLNHLVRTDLQDNLRKATVDLHLAKEAQRKAKELFDRSLQESMVAAGLGKRALVRHVHAHAHHGNCSDKEVVSEVTNVHSRDDGTIMVMVRLGSVSKPGKITDQYASVAMLDIIKLEGARSATPFGY